MRPISRRDFVARLSAGAGGLVGYATLAGACSPSSARQTASRMYIGTYTRGGSQGIYRASFDPVSGAVRLDGVAAELENPSYLAVNPDRSRLYAVSEVADFQGTDGGGVVAFAIEADGGLRELGRQPTQGAHPCYVSVDPAGEFVMVANYSSGNAALFRLEADGSLAPAADVVQHRGSGPNARRQEGPHAHCIMMGPEERYVFVVDLGIDRVVGYVLDRKGARLVPAPEDAGVAARSGAGPRHLTFHSDGRRAFLINELDSTLTALSYDPDSGSMESVGTVSTLPPDFTGDNTCADVHVSSSGRFVYGSNRGHDSIAVFTIEDDGRLTLVQHQSTLGRTPRNFAIAPGGDFLIAANQDSSSLVTFAIDQATGRLSPVGDPVEVPTPVCVTFQ